jgi:ankyrin repeat protein
MAARHGRMDVFRVLLEKGRIKNAKTKGGGTVLRMAAGNGLVEVVRLLLDANNIRKDVQDEVRPWLSCLPGCAAFAWQHLPSRCVLRCHAAGWLDADLLGGAQRAHGGGEPAAAARGKQGIAEQRRQDAAGCGEGAGHARLARDRLSKQAAALDVTHQNMRPIHLS